MNSTAQHEDKELALFIGSHQKALVTHVADDWATRLGTSAQELTSSIDTMLTQLIDALETGSQERFLKSFIEWVIARAEQGMNGMEPGELLNLTHSLTGHLWDVVIKNSNTLTIPVVTSLRDLMGLVTSAQITAVDALVAAYKDRQYQILRQERERLIQQVREISTPVIKVWEEVLVLPLVGTIDAIRAARVMEDLLQGIVTQQAEIVIIDVTGVPLVDTNVVSYLMQTIKAAGLLGARSVLVGIGADIAQTMVQLGIDLQGVETRSNLQAGIAFALQVLRLQIVPQDRDDVAYEVG